MGKSGSSADSGFSVEHADKRDKKSTIEISLFIFFYAKITDDLFYLNSKSASIQDLKIPV
ncbi:hypothetical protein SPONL_1754 [uncultured Candidatus Thioglobus sp.]|nr:hypothetical protein SPONL_1754 [uncultured Candidatus Thioglobus sp.]